MDAVKEKYQKQVARQIITELGKKRMAGSFSPTISQAKEEVIKMIEQLPDEASVADIMAELYFRQKVDAGLQELDQGKGVPHEQVEERLKKWLA